jgi:hypothetical protein
MEELILFNGKINNGRNIDYIQILQKIRGMVKKIERNSKMEIWCCGSQRIPKLKKGNSFFHTIKHIK